LVVPLIIFALRGAYTGESISIMHDYNRTAIITPSPVQPIITSKAAVPSESPVPEQPVRSRALSPASLRSLAVAVLRQEAKEVLPVAQDDLCKAKLPPATHGRRNIPTSIDAGPRLLTLDAPVTKSLAALPSAAVSSPGETKAKDALPSISHSFNALSIRLSNALSPLFVSVNQDLRELLEAIDLLLQSVARLQNAAGRGVGGLVYEVSIHATKGVEHLAKQAAHGIHEISKQASDSFGEISKQTSQGVQVFTNKVLDIAHSASEHAYSRHSRAKKNARKVRETGEMYAQKIQKGLVEVKELAGGFLTQAERNGWKITSRQTREQRKQARRKRRENRKEKVRRMFNRIRLV